MQQSAAIGAALAVSPALHAQGVNEQLNMGFIGLGWRGGDLLKQFSNLPDVRIAALCDVDQQLLDAAAKDQPGAKKYADLRKLFDDKDVDAVAIATCNHWHALAAIWACQAGKDVYVEKPLAHNHWEGQQLVKAARKYDRIVQVGTQQRSDPLQAGAQRVSPHGQAARRDQIRRGLPVWPPATDRQAHEAARDSQHGRLRPVARPGQRSAHLSRQAALRLALGLEHGQRRAGQLGRARAWTMP